VARNGKIVIYDLYLRAHAVLSEPEIKQKHISAKPRQSPKLWPEFALIFDTETKLDLEHTLNFGVWQFCQLQGSDYVAIQEGIFYRDGLSSEERQTITAYAQKYNADRPRDDNPGDLIVFARAEFVERVFWEAVRAGALIVGFNLPFDIARIAVRWTEAQNGGFSFVLSELDEKHLDNIHRPRD
jgi:hypothetical protein